MAESSENPAVRGGVPMKKFSLGFVTVLSTLLIGVAAPATAADHGSNPGKTGSRLACERACHDDHRRWVDLCLANHNPREITPSARGQCVDAGAERLKQCLGRCR
jgi:hypothetical protein